MFSRDFWLKRIFSAWEKAPIVWFAGVRRVGKTTLAQSIPDTLFLDCDLPSVRQRLKDPESFYNSVTKPIIIFDEIHQLEDPSNILKIGADVYPHFKILATGSSTLAATRKFRDSLTGRKRNINLLPVLPSELDLFGIRDLKERIQKGGLPPALLAPVPDPEFYAEWVDSFYARDIQELFKIEKRAGFLRLFEYIIQSNGGMVELNTLAKVSNLTVPTVNNYLQMLETTFAVHCLRPFHGGGKKEIVKQPKYYAFDTGFVAYFKGITHPTSQDCGLLLENLTLDVLKSIHNIPKIHFWRDREQREIDFVCPSLNKKIVDVIECKWTADAFDPHALLKFREVYPNGRNFVVSSQTTPAYSQRFKTFDVTFISLVELSTFLTT